MPKVKTFRITSNFGVPDKDIRIWLDETEKDIGFISVSTTFIPSVGTADPRLTVIVTKLDDYEEDL